MRYILGLLLSISLSTMANTLSLTLKNAPTAEVLTYLAEENNQNIVLFDNIKEIKSLRIENSHFDQILKSIAQINQLSIRKENNIYYISDKKESPSLGKDIQQAISLVNRPPKLITKRIKLYYAKASEMIDSVTKGMGNILSENGYIHYDDRSNSLIIKDSATAIANFEKLVKELDKPTEQIAIEARIVTISSEHLQELGVRWGAFSPSENYHKFTGNLASKGASAGDLNVNFPVLNGASMALQVATINSRVLDLELTALERENSIEIIANPRLMTTDKKSASIKQGTEIPYALYNKKSETMDIEFKEAVLGLEVVPHISKNNQILLDLVVTQNSPNDQNGVNALTTIDKQELKTQVFAKHSETIVLGGIFQHLISKSEDKVPILGSIPVIKHLFSQSRDKISKRELVIFVTPYIIPQTPLTEQKKSKKSQQK